MTFHDRIVTELPIREHIARVQLLRACGVQIYVLKVADCRGLDPHRLSQCSLSFPKLVNAMNEPLGKTAVPLNSTVDQCDPEALRNIRSGSILSSLLVAL